MRTKTFLYKFRALNLCGALLLCTSPAFATLGDDDFQGAALGTLHNQNSGTGWSNPWETIPANSTVAEVVNFVSAGYAPLIYFIPNGNPGPGQLVAIPKGLTISGNGDSIITRTVGPINSPVVYVSIVMRVDEAPTFPNNVFLSMWFDSTKSGPHTSNPGFGLKANGGNGSTPLDLYGRLALNNEAYLPTSDLFGREGETFYLVARLQKGPATGPTDPYTSLTVWLNPPINAENDVNFPGVTSLTGSAITSFSEIGLRSVNFPAGFRMSVGPILTGSTFISVFPEPEGPLAVDLVSFDGEENTNGVQLTWETSAEIDNAGFNLYYSSRSQSGVVTPTKVNTTLIPANGSETAGATYSFQDNNPLSAGEERTYYLEDVELGGATALHGPVILGSFSAEPASSVGSWMIYTD